MTPVIALLLSVIFMSDNIEGRNPNWLIIGHDNALRRIRNEDSDEEYGEEIMMEEDSIPRKDSVLGPKVRSTKLWPEDDEWAKRPKPPLGSKHDGLGVWTSWIME